MIQYHEFFSEFPPVSKEDWMRQIAKDLKGKPLEDLVWQAEADLAVSPFVHADDFPDPLSPLSAAPNHWEICEAVAVQDAGAANRQALTALEGGAWGLQLEFDAAPTLQTLSVLFEGIYLDFIGLHLSGVGISQNPGAALALLDRVARQHGLDAARLRGSTDYDPAVATTAAPLQPDWRYLADVLGYAAENFPQFRLLTLSGPHAPDLMRRANLYIEKLVERGLRPEQVAAQIQFHLHIGPSYFLEMATLRAMRVVWYNLLRAWGAELQEASVAVSFRPEAYTDDLYTNMIRATTMSMSAVLGGANRLTVLPYDAGRASQAQYPQAFSRRISRNVQHLLKMESGLDELADPAAGSYYIETLTRQLAERMWTALGRQV